VSHYKSNVRDQEFNLFEVFGVDKALGQGEYSELDADTAREHLTRINRMKIRLLGDAVLRRRAWEVADRLGWAHTYDAEYVALTQLQAEAFVTLDAELVRSVEGLVATATVAALGAKPA
jgi:predicted nucleic acid-binding protein